jgi:hypothetical protein
MKRKENNFEDNNRIEEDNLEENSSFQENIVQSGISSLSIQSASEFDS